MAALPKIGDKPGSFTVAPTAKKDATASASRVSSAPKNLFTRAGRESASLRAETSVSTKYVRRARAATGFAARVKPT